MRKKIKKVRNSKKTIPNYVNTEKNEKARPTKTDREFMQYMFLNGAISRKFIKEKFKYSEKMFRRLNSLPHLNLHHETELQVDENGKEKIVNRYLYSLSKEGVTFAIKQGWGAFHQHYNGYEHTLKAEEVLYKLVNQDKVDINKILNENTQKQMYAATIIEERNKLKKARYKVKSKKEKEKIGDISITDFAYKDQNNNYVAVEIVTRHYKERHKINHKNYATLVLGTENYIEY